VITLDEALQILEGETRALDTIELPLERARGHVLAEPIAADRDFPPTDRSAMDGWAVRAADAAAPGAELEIVGEVRAGQPVGGIRVGPGQAVSIMTGAIVPPGADAVVMVEKTAQVAGAGRVRIDDTPRRGQHVRRRGEDLARGATALEAGSPIHAPEIAALAAVGRTTVKVVRRPVVSVLTTGDEIVEPERTPAEHQIRNSNAPALATQLAAMGIEARVLGIVGDERDDLRRRIERGLAGDVLLITGGVSVGKYDLVAETLAAAGMRRLFHKIAVKPGKPILAGRRGDCLIFGLPGNPVSSFTGFVLLVAPALRRMLGYRRWANRAQRAPLAEPLRVPPGRESYLLARLEPADEGWTVRRVSHTGSGDILALARANAFIVCPASGCDHPAGAPVPVLPWTDHVHR